MRQKNAPIVKGPTARLFVRFFIAYLFALPLAIPLALRGSPKLSATQVGFIEFFFVPLALFGALLIFSKPFLWLLAFCKGAFDTVLLLRITRWARSGNIGILSWNACVALIAVSFLIFTTAAARAQLFACTTTKRDLRLLRSGGFWLYLIEALLFLILAYSLYALWPELLSRLGVLPLPH